MDVSSTAWVETVGELASSFEVIPLSIPTCYHSSFCLAISFLHDEHMALKNLLFLFVCEIGVSFRDKSIPPMQLADFLHTSVLGIGAPLLQSSLEGQLLHK